MTREERADHCRRIAQSGGMTTHQRYGSAHYRVLGKAGYAATVKAHGHARAVAIVQGKGWTPRKPDLLSDLAAGRELAAMAAD